MCGRMFWDVTEKEIVEELGIDRVIQSVDPNYNAAPSQFIPVVVAGSRHLDLYKWGLLPKWAKDKKMANYTINARAETVMEKPAFRESFRDFRVLVVCSGFFEWKNKIPHVIRLKGKKVFCFAGIASIWKDKEVGGGVATVSVITCPANSFMKKLHHRMPVILDEEKYDDWIDSGNKNYDKLSSWLKPYDSDKMTEHIGSVKLNSPRNNKKEYLMAGEKQATLR